MQVTISAVDYKLKPIKCSGQMFINYHNTGYRELTVRIAENVSAVQSDIAAWANPCALKTGKVDLL